MGSDGPYAQDLKDQANHHHQVRLELRSAAPPEDLAPGARWFDVLVEHQSAGQARIPDELIEGAQRHARHPTAEAAVVEVEEDPTTWSVLTIAGKLWECLPSPVRDLLEPSGRDGSRRILLTLEGDAVRLPWEAINFHHHGAATPGYSGHWQIERFVPPAGPSTQVTDPLDRSPRVLLVIGSVEPRSRDCEFSRLLDVDAIASAIPGLVETTPRGAPPEFVLQRIGSGEFDAVHFIGHSDATETRPATCLDLDQSNDSENLAPALELDAFRAAVHRGGIRLVVLQACRTTDNIAPRLLATAAEDGAASPLLDVVGMSAMLPSRACPAWAESFYGELQKPGIGIGRAMQAALEHALLTGKHDADPTLAWVPVHFTRALVERACHDPEATLLETYCTRVATLCNRLPGDLAHHDAGLSRIHIDLEMQTALGHSAALTERAGDILGLAELLKVGMRRFVLLGEPGSGKTTTLRQHAHALAHRGGLAKLPVFIRLPDWHTDFVESGSKRPLDHFVDYVIQEYELPDGFADVLRQRARIGEVVLLLDGLDEVADAAAVKKLAHRLADADWQHCQVAVTSRTTYYDRGGLDPSLFHHAELRPLSSSQQTELLEKLFAVWTTDDSEHAEPWTDHAPGFASHLVDWLDHRDRGRALRAMRSNPLFLTEIGRSAFEAGPDDDHPIGESRAEVYKQLLHSTLRRDHQAGIAEGRDRPVPRETLAIYGWLALDMIKKREIDLRGERAVIDRLAAGEEAGAISLPDGVDDWDELVRQERRLFGPHRQGVRSAKSRWRFFHRNFGELLAAEALAREWTQLDHDAGRLLDSLDLEVRSPPAPPPGFSNIRDLVRNRQEALRLQNRRPRSVDEAVQDLSTYWPRINIPVEFAEAARSFLEWDAHQDTLSDYWTEPLSILAGATENPLPLLDELVRRGNPTLAERSIARMDHLSVELIGRALFDATASPPATGWFSEPEMRQTVYEVLADGVEPSERSRVCTLLEQNCDGTTDRTELWFVSQALRALADRGEPSATTTLATLLDRLPDLPPGTLERSRWCAVPGTDELLDERGQPTPFRQGSPMDEDGRFDDEGPIDESRIGNPFWIGRTVVTYDEYLTFDPAHETHSLLPPECRAADMPAVCVNHHQASMYCRWLEHWLRGHLRRDDIRVRLPSETEWEYAARAGTDTPYWAGSTEHDLARVAHYDQAPQKGRPRPVAQAEPNPWGLHDVHGNVLEWCADWFGPYPRDHTLVDYRGPAGGSARVLRGGSFHDGPRDCRSACRYFNRPGDAYGNVGFRVVLAAPGLDPSIFDL